MTDFRPEIAELKQFSAPYIKEDTSVSKIMTHVMVGLLPSLILSGILFGGSALLLTGFCILTSLLWEFIICLILKRKNSINDLSAAVTGMIFAYMLPTGFPFWQAAIHPPSEVGRFSSLRPGRISTDRARWWRRVRQSGKQSRPSGSPSCRC